MAKVIKSEGIAAVGRSLLALSTKVVPIDAHCTGDHWSSQDEEHLARLIALISMGQATQAAHIIRELAPATPAFTAAEIIAEAKIRLTVGKKTKDGRTGYPEEQRDGFIFEAISWIAARQAHGVEALLLAPHVSATSQGLDGLMIEITPDKTQVTRTTIFEDKCTEDPRATFRAKVIPAFLDRHQNKRSAELVDGAATLLRTAGTDEAAAAALAAAVMDRARRRYRASFAVPPEFDGEEQRKKLFKGYEKLTDITREQRVGACFVVPGDLRESIEHLAVLARAYLENLRRNCDV